MYLNINGYSLWSKDKEAQFLESIFSSDASKVSFNNNLDFKTNKQGLNAVFKKTINKDWLIDALLFYDRSHTNTDKNFQSSDVFSWFNSNSFHLYQKTNALSTDTGIQGRATWNLGNSKLIFRGFSGYSHENVNNNAANEQLYQFNSTYKKQENLVGIQYQGIAQKPVFSYSLGLQYNNTSHLFNTTSNKQSINVLLPNLSVSKNLGKGLSAYASYNTNLSSFSVLQFLTGNMIDDYRSYSTPSDVTPEKMLTNSYSVGVMYNVPEKNIFSSVSLSHNAVRKKLDKTYDNEALVTQQSFQYINFNNTTSSNITFSKKFRSIPYGIRFNTFGTISQLETILNKTTSINTNYNASVKLNLQSYYKDSWVNFNATLNYMNNTSKNIFNNIENQSKLESFTPSVGLTGVALYKKLNWNLNSYYYMYKASSIRSKNVFDLGFTTQYNVKENIQLYVNARNILNIGDTNEKNSFIATPYFTQEVIMKTIPGFVNVGAIFSF